MQCTKSKGFDFVYNHHFLCNPQSSKGLTLSTTSFFGQCTKFKGFDFVNNPHSGFYQIAARQIIYLTLIYRTWLGHELLQRLNCCNDWLCVKLPRECLNWNIRASFLIYNLCNDVEQRWNLIKKRCNAMSYVLSYLSLCGKYFV